MLLELLLTAMVLIAAGTDIASRRIPNALVASGLAAALMLHLFSPAGGGGSAWLLGMLAGAATLLPFYIVRGMGAGDVKLMAAVGAFIGPWEVVQVALATFLIGGVWALGLVLWRGQWRSTWDNLCLIASPLLIRLRLGTPLPVKAGPSATRLPYGVAIALGTLTMLMLQSA